jgi:hypothetical protein
MIMWERIEGLCVILLDVCVIVTNENIPCLEHCVCMLFIFVILGWILERWDGVMWTGLVWLRIGTGRESCCEFGIEPMGSMKCWETYFCNTSSQSFYFYFAQFTLWYKFVGNRRRRIPCDVHNFVSIRVSKLFSITC